MSVIERFVTFFSEDPQNQEVAYFSDKDTDRIIPGCGVVIRPQTLLIDEIKTTPGITAHLLINQSDGFGRKYDNILHPRSFFADIDRQVEKEEMKEILFKYRPQMVVRSSPGKFHLYWLCSEHVEWGAWETIQRGINAILDARDESTWVRTHTMRIPGLTRITKSGESYLPQLIHRDEVRTHHSEDTIAELFPYVFERGELAEEEYKTKRKDYTSHVLEKINRSEKLSLEGKVSKGMRNDTLYQVSKTLVLERRVGTIDELGQMVGTLNAQIEMEVGGPLPEDEVKEVIKSAWQRGNKALEKKSKAITQYFDSTPVELNSDQVSTELIQMDSEGNIRGEVIEGRLPYEYRYHFSVHNAEDWYADEAIVERVLERYGQYMRRVEGDDLFVFNTEKRVWVKQSGKYKGELIELLKVVLNEMVYSYEFQQKFGVNNKGEPCKAKLQRERERFRGISKMSQYAKRITDDALVTCMREADFDPNPNLVYVTNGALDISTGELRRVEPEDLLMNRINIEWSPASQCPRWEKFLSEIFEDASEPEEMILCLQEIFGYSLSGDMRVQAVYFHVGTGANGKSTVLGVLRKLCGEYGKLLAPDVLGKKNDKFERMGQMLKNSRCAIIDDIELTTEINEAFVKNITGRLIQARALFAEHVEVRNTAKVHMGMNEMPTPESASDGYFRRIRVLNYDRKFKNDPVKGSEIERMVEEELSGIFRWAVLGYQRYLKQGFIRAPQETVIAQEEYRDSTAISENMLRAMFEVGGNDDFLPSKDIYETVQDYCREEGLKGYGSAIALSKVVAEVFRVKPFLKKIEGKPMRGFELKLSEEFRKREGL